MSIKTRLSIQFTLLMTSILLFFSVLVYYFSYNNQLGKFREYLFDSARNSAILLINVQEVDSSLLKKIHQSTVQREQEETVITDTAFTVLYSNNALLLSEEQLKIHYTNSGKKYFSLSDKDGVCYSHRYNSKSFYVFVLAWDKSRREKLSELREILIWGIIFSAWLSVILSYFFSVRALKPIANIIRSVQEINSRRLYKRLDEGRGKDEIEQLAMTFNKMLTDLEVSFRNQEEFVLNASHEMRTPLSVMIAESDYILDREREKKEYENHIRELIIDLKKINELLNSLLEMARVGNDRNISFSVIRLDEVVFTAILQAKTKYPERRIIPRVEYPGESEELLIRGNPGLLVILFKNILDNSCKFSGGDIAVDILTLESSLEVKVSDQGIGIPAAEIDNILKPFQRAANARYIGGFGVGLSLVSRIADLHGTSMKIESRENKGTVISIVFGRELQRE